MADDQSIDVLRARIEALEREAVERNAEIENQREALKNAHREMEVEAALERVRARSMAMYASDEIAETASVLYEQLERLGIELARCSFVFPVDDEGTEAQVWGSSSDTHGNKIQILGTFKTDFLPALREAARAWHEKKGFFWFKLEGDELKTFHQTMSATVSFPDASDDATPLPPTEYHYHFHFKYGMIGAIRFDPLSEDDQQVLKRFARVFEQTYTRFLDLQKAETQAREAQIEAALERVRARTMAMHHSDELTEVAGTVFTQLNALNINALRRVSILIMSEDDQFFSFWSSSTNDQFGVQCVTVPYYENAVVRKGVEFWLSDEETMSFEVAGQEREDFVAHVIRHGWKYPPGEKPPPDVEFQLTRFKYGLLNVVSYEAVEASTFDILKRFARVFEQTYTRFLDLQKAEAQAREAQIEAALERVRARTMAMHHSDELTEVAGVVSQQLRSLDISALRRVSIMIMNPDEGTASFWASSATDQFGVHRVTIPMDEDAVVREIVDVWRSNKDLEFSVLEGKRLKDFVVHIINHGWVYPQGESQPDTVCFNYSRFKHGLLVPITYETVREDDIDIFKRFARVFEQTYTRFLDLQRAEAQAREAEIEVALERVRARSMAMHQSNELMEVAVVLFEQLRSLAIPSLRRATVLIMDADEQSASFWSSSTTGDGGIQQVQLHKDEDETARNIIDGWRSKQDAFSLALEGKTFKDFVAYIMKHGWTYPPGESAPDHLMLNCARFKHGLINAVTYDPIEDDAFDILKRFARVFEQTYTRFLDLQRAEEQAREAEIEAALERVRARTMAMHHSDELTEVAGVLFEQFRTLEIPDLRRAAIMIPDMEKGQLSFWASSTSDQFGILRVTTPLDQNVIVEQCMDGWVNNQDRFVVLIEGQEMHDFVAHIVEHGWRFPSGETEQERLYFNLSRFKHGYLNAVSFQAIDEDNFDILERFARVFEQTFTRFRDLQRAEAQAREAEIEAALERIRSRTMAMQHSGELCEVVGVVYDQMDRLGFDAYMGDIIIYDEETGGAEFWLSIPEQSVLPMCYQVPFVDHVIYRSHYKAWQEGVTYQVIRLYGDEKKSYDAFLFEHTGFKDIPESVREMMKAVEDCYLNEAFMTHGLIEAIGPEPLPDDKAQILQRIARVVDQAYTRVVDLQKAEDRAREAVRQAALDRVRAEIASMRTTEDLDRITPLVWRELTTLGVPFFRCGVFIMDESTELIRAYLTNPEGQSLAALNLPYDSAETTRQAVEYWRNQQVYTFAWDRDDLLAWNKSMTEQGHIQPTELYEEPPEEVVLQFVPFAQGMLYVGTPEVLSDDQIDLVQSLADAFAVAYARYDDFKQLEAALTELKTTQNQLIHAEKMASLGEMTAGIAHEIKNPLNFVNNFAELMGELADELNDEIHTMLGESGAEESHQFKDILADLKSNAEMIARHGRRADDIVRSMMQHASGSSGERQPVAVNALVEEYVNLAYHGMRATNPGTTVEIDRDYSDHVGEALINVQEMGRVLLNLLSNAFDAVADHEQPTVRVLTNRTEDAIQIRVTDNGPGIPKNLLAKIFEPFFTTKPTGSGTGLGLSLSYDIVTQGHGGTLEVESTEDKGATFTITLPG